MPKLSKKLKGHLSYKFVYLYYSLLTLLFRCMQFSCKVTCSRRTQEHMVFLVFSDHRNFVFILHMDFLTSH